jgi:hypothetical protein
VPPQFSQDLETRQQLEAESRGGDRDEHDLPIPLYTTPHISKDTPMTKPMTKPLFKKPTLNARPKPVVKSQVNKVNEEIKKAQLEEAQKRFIKAQEEKKKAEIARIKAEEERKKADKKAQSAGGGLTGAVKKAIAKEEAKKAKAEEEKRKKEEEKAKLEMELAQKELQEVVISQIDKEAIQRQIAQNLQQKPLLGGIGMGAIKPAKPMPLPEIKPESPKYNFKDLNENNTKGGTIESMGMAGKCITMDCGTDEKCKKEEKNKGSGRTVKLTNCSGFDDKAQGFMYYSPTQLLRIGYKKGRNICLDTNTSKNKKLMSSKCDKHNNKRFEYLADTNQIKMRQWKDPYCLEASGSEIYAKPCNPDNKNQKWKINKRV